MSIFTKEGISAGMGNSMNIRRKATALSMAVTVSLWVFFAADIKNTLLFRFFEHPGFFDFSKVKTAKERAETARGFAAPHLLPSRL